MIKTIARILGGSVLILIVVAVVLFLLQPRIPLGKLSAPASALLTFLTGKEQLISGNYFLVPGTWTTLSVEDGSLELTGKEEFRLKAKINSAKTIVHLWSLFAGQINLDGITVHGMSLDILAGEKKEKSEVDKEEGKKFRTEPMSFSLRQTGPINLTDITASITLTETEPQIKFQLEKSEGRVSSESPGQLKIEAVLDGRKFKADIEGGPLAGLAATDTDWPFSIHIRHKSVAADINGVLARVAADPQLTANVSLSGEHFDDLASIFGFHGSKKQPFVLQASTTLSREEIRADFTRLQPGTANLLLSASMNHPGSQKSQYNFKVRGELLDIDTLKGFITPEKQKSLHSKRNIKTAKISRDDILFPGTFPIRNLTLDLDIKDLLMAGKRMKNVRLNAVLDEGLVDSAPFAVTFRNSSLSGHYSLNIGTSVPQLSAHLDTNAFNIGAILKDLRLADDIFLHINHVKTDLNTNGKTLGELFDNLVFTINASDGIFEYHDPNSRIVLPISLHHSKIVGVPGEKIKLNMQGNIDVTPINISMEFEDRRDEPPESVKDISFMQHVQVADTHWEFIGKIPLPYKSEGTSLHSRLTGEQLSSLNELLNLKLPDIGPYTISGTLNIVEEGYLFNEIQVQMGSSSIMGDVSIDTKAIPPAIRIGLQAQSIQLNDFREIQAGSKDAVIVSRKQVLEKKAEPEPEQKQPYLTDQSVLDSYNASINIEVKEVLSGADYLGNGTLKIQQQQGRFMVDPLLLNLPSGAAVAVVFSLEPSVHERLYRLNILINDLDYGMVGRWFKSDTDISGIINLRTGIEAASPDLQSIMANASGFFDFSIQPGQLRAGVIDLWAVNLLSHLFPFLTPSGESRINCLAGRFNLKDGILSQEELLMDTSRIQVKGTVEVDFNRNWIESFLRPVPKRSQFFSLATPIRISGPISDFYIGVSPGGAIQTVVRLVTAYIIVPVQWITQHKLPEDETAACLQLFKERVQ